MSKVYGFYGCSDDLFMLTLNGKDIEEIYPPQQYLIQTENGVGVVVGATYGVRNGVWQIGIEPIDEDIPIPENWPVMISLEKSRGYSTYLEMTVPDNASYLVVNGDDDE